MKRWLRRIRGALGLGVTWAIGWTVTGLVAVIAAGALGFNTAVVDIWVPVFAIPGFLGGVTFSTLLGIAERRRTLGELSLARFAIWGAFGGFLVPLIPVTMVLTGLATVNPGAPGPWAFAAIMVGPMVGLSAVSAAGSLALARRAEQQVLLDADVDVSDLGLTGDEVKELLDGEV